MKHLIIYTKSGIERVEFSSDLATVLAKIYKNSKDVYIAEYYNNDILNEVYFVQCVITCSSVLVFNLYRLKVSGHYSLLTNSTIFLLTKLDEEEIINFTAKFEELKNNFSTEEAENLLISLQKRCRAILEAIESTGTITRPISSTKSANFD